MKLTDPERLILRMLADITEHLNIHEGFDGRFINAALDTDNTWGLRWKYSGFFKDAYEEPPEVGEVVEILEMWEVLEESFGNLSWTDQATLRNSESSFVRAVYFMGFDRTEEGKQVSIAQFLVDDLERFDLFKGRRLDSGAPFALAGYRRMRPVFKRIPDAKPQPSLGLKLLSAQELVDVLQAQRPDGRGLTLVTSPST